jgi:nucleotide-binding universal stress UspA family protein
MRTGPESSLFQSGHGATIVVPLDGSVQALDALPVARGFAALIDSTIHVVHVSPDSLPYEDLCARLKLTPEQLSDCILDQRTGSPATAIIQEAEQWNSSLIVMCPYTAAKAEGGLGSIAQEILTNTPCPIVLVPPGRGQRPWSLRHLLLPHDGTPTSAIAIRPMTDLAQRAEARVTVLHVTTAAAAPPEERGTFAAPRYLDQPHHEWPAWGREFLHRACASAKPPAHVTLRTVFCTEDIGEATVRFASEHETDLIALAWRRRLDPKRARTMRSVIQHTRCPAMIYPIRGQSRSGVSDTVAAQGPHVDGD